MHAAKRKHVRLGVLCFAFLALFADASAQTTRAPAGAKDDPAFAEWLKCTMEMSTRDAADSSIKALLPKAKADDASAIYSLGKTYLHRYESGGSDPADLENARKWFARGLFLLRCQNRDDDPDIQSLIGMHYEGMCEYREAIAWFSRASLQGDGEAQNSLGMLYLQGRGVPKDEIEALARLYIGTASGRNPAYIEFRDELEKSLGHDNALKAQQRAKEIVREVEGAKKTREGHLPETAPSSAK